MWGGGEGGYRLAHGLKILVNVVRVLVRLRLSYGQAMPHLSETGLYFSAFRNSV